MLEERPAGDVVVFYQVRSESDAVLLNEVRQLAAAPRGWLHVLTGRTEQGSRPVEPEALRSLVPCITERDVYVCGPPARAAARAARPAEVAGAQPQVHAEKFSLA